MKVDSTTSLSFKRVGSQWKLVWHWQREKVRDGVPFAGSTIFASREIENVETCVTDTGTYRKASVCQLLPKLVDAMKAEHAERVSALRKGFMALSAVHSLLDGEDKTVVHSETASQAAVKEGK